MQQTNPWYDERRIVSRRVAPLFYFLRQRRQRRDTAAALPLGSKQVRFNAHLSGARQSELDGLLIHCRGELGVYGIPNSNKLAHTARRVCGNPGHIRRPLKEQVHHLASRRLVEHEVAGARCNRPEEKALLSLFAVVEPADGPRVRHALDAPPDYSLPRLVAMQVSQHRCARLCRIQAAERKFVVFTSHRHTVLCHGATHGAVADENGRNAGGAGSEVLLREQSQHQARKHITHCI